MEIALIGAAIELIEKLIPKIAELVKSGQVTPEEQQKVLDKYNALVEKLEEGFSGPEWEPSGR